MILATAPVYQLPPTPEVNWHGFAPELILFAAAILIIIGRSVVRNSPTVYAMSYFTAAVGIFGAGVFTLAQWIVWHDSGAYTTFAGMIVVDGFSIFIRVVVLLALVLVLVLSYPYLRREDIPGPEYVALVMLSAVGMMLMGSAFNLITVFLALEILSIALYVLVAIDRKRFTSQEAGLKYFVLGAVASAFFLYGVALTYGATGSTSIPRIGVFLGAHGADGLVLAGMVLMIVGLGFKVAAVPFHMWAPDVYDGAPTPITAFMAAATKAAAFAAILRVLLDAFPSQVHEWRPVIFTLAALSLLVGSIAALVQTNIKRMLAYSSISHAGYILIAVQAGTPKGVSAALFYLFTYAFMTIGTFAIVLTMAPPGDDSHQLSSFKGLARRRPVLAGALTFLLLAQAGVPLTGGFVAKLTVFSAGIQARQYALVIIGVLSAAIAAFFYLRVVVVMYLSDDTAEAGNPGPTRPAIPIPVATGIVVAIAVVATLYLGVSPGNILDFARDAQLIGLR